MSCAVLTAQFSETQGKGKAGRPRRLRGGRSTELGLEGQVAFRHRLQRREGTAGQSGGSKPAPGSLEVEMHVACQVS